MALRATTVFLFRATITSLLMVLFILDADFCEGLLKKVQKIGGAGNHG